MKKELKQTKQKIAKLLDKKALIDKQLEPLYIREEELENETVIKEFRSQKISLDDFLKLVRDNKKEEKKEKALIEKSKTETTKNNDWRNKIDEKSK